jgi:hypothetical protein
VRSRLQRARVRPTCLILAAALLAAVGTVPAATATGAAARVTFVGDSVAEEIGYSSRAEGILGRHVHLDLAACRRLVQPSCTVEGVTPPTVLQLVRSEGAGLGPTVVVAVGNNDPALLYAHDLGLVVAALERVHVHRILWLTVRAVHHPDLIVNAAIRAAAKERRDVELVDWNRYSRSHPSWFREDGLHLSPAGAVAMATLVHRTLAAG